MFWVKEWERITARINGFAAASRIVDAGAPTRLGVPQYLHDQWNSIFSAINDFFTNHSAAIPQEANECLDEFKKKYAAVIKSPKPENVPSRLAYLIALKSELDFLLVSSDVLLAATSERAFLHLQRLIVADEDVKVKWDRAFEAGEVACEKLGGAHMLHHGIWAFKTDAAGARTDLILGEPAIPTDMTQRALEGLVLTEWKLVPVSLEATRIAQDARKQAETYSSGILGGFELHRVRYIVLVSKQHLAPIADVTMQNAVYRHINIATDPDLPSKAAKKN